MFNDGPEGNSGKFPVAEIRGQKWFAQNPGAALFGEINGRAGDIDAQGLIIISEAMSQLVEKGAGGATNVEDRARQTKAAKEFQFAIEADGGVVALEFIR